MLERAGIFPEQNFYDDDERQLAFATRDPNIGVARVPDDENADGKSVHPEVRKSVCEALDVEHHFLSGSYGRKTQAKKLKDVDIIVGAASSSVSLSVIDKIVNAGVMQISPANTSTAFDTYKDEGLYFRTAPSDVLQGRVLAGLVAADGFTDIAILARQDSYGEALADNAEKFFEEGGGSVVLKELYAPDASTFTAEVNAAKAEDPDAIILIAFDETKKIIPEMIKAGIGPNS